MWDVCTSHADYISCNVTSSDVDHVTSLHIGVVSPTSDEIGDVASTSLGLIPWKVFIVATVLARKFHKNLRNFRWKDAWLYVYVFRLKKSLSGTETMARRISSRKVEIQNTKKIQGGETKRKKKDESSGTTHESMACRIHDGAHIWKDCLDNKFNKQKKKESYRRKD